MPVIRLLLLYNALHTTLSGFLFSSSIAVIRVCRAVVFVLHRDFRQWRLLPAHGRLSLTFMFSWTCEVVFDYTLKYA